MQRVKQRFLPGIVVLAMFATGISDAVAQTATNDALRLAVDPLQIKLVRSKVVLENGKEVMQSAAAAKPGEILEEVATYTNISRAALKSVEATLPVPPNTELVMASVKPANAKASTDGKRFSPIPLTRKVRQPNGVEVEQAVPLGEYRYLRWYPGDLAPDRPASFSARFKVANTPAGPDNAAK